MIEAAVYTGNRTISVETVPEVPPGPDDVQIEVSHCGICGTDLHAYLGHMDQRLGDRRIIGHEMSGRVIAMGENVSSVAEGDRVVVRPLVHCGDCPACASGLEHICHNLKFLGLDSDGAFQHRWSVPEQTVHRLPEGLPLDHAALVEPLAVAAHDVARADVGPGDDVLVIGGGPIGMLVALAARRQGAEVMITEINARRLELAREMGFDVIDPSSVDAQAAIESATNGKGCDVVFEVSGSQAGVDLMTKAAAARGKICMVAIHATKPQVDLFAFFWRELEMVGARVYERADFDRAIDWLADGIGAERLITSVRPLAEIADAFRDLTEVPGSMKTLIKLN